MAKQKNEMVQRPEDEAEPVRAEHRVAPLVDVYENDDEILLRVDVPGVDDDGLNIQLDGRQLDIEARQSQPEDGTGYEPIAFVRSFTVPNTVDAEKVSANLEMGVLDLHLPKSEAAKPRRIQVTTT
jgi:HSP20 family molecular chaperone IbpA